jgi:hypothetical protein
VSACARRSQAVHPGVRRRAGRPGEPFPKGPCQEDADLKPAAHVCCRRLKEVLTFDVLSRRNGGGIRAAVAVARAAGKTEEYFDVTRTVRSGAT